MDTRSRRVHGLVYSTVLAVAATALLLAFPVVSIGYDPQKIDVIDERLSTPSGIGPFQCAALSPTWSKPKHVRSASIPQAGATQGSNSYDRIFKVIVTHPAGRPIDPNFTVRIVGSNGVTVAESPERPAVLFQDGPTESIYCVEVTDIQSPLADGTEPTVTSFTYQFAFRDAATGGTGTGKSETYLALWDVPENWVWMTNSLRYGGRDRGGDEWVRRGTFRWLDRVRQGQSGSLTAEQLHFNDISCEHGRDCGHTSHGEGKHIDINHLWPNPAGQAMANYLAVRDAARWIAFIHKLGGALPAQDLKLLQDWVTRSRTFVSAALGDQYVAQLIGPYGRKVAPLENGWLEQLLRCGNIIYRDGQVLRTVSLNVGVIQAPGVACTGPTTARLIFRGDHDDHWHIDINARALE